MVSQLSEGGIGGRYIDRKQKQKTKTTEELGMPHADGLVTKTVQLNVLLVVEKCLVLFKLINEMQKQQKILLDQMVQEASESSDDAGESCEDKIDNIIGDFDITSSVRSVGYFILNDDACTLWKFMQMFNFRKNVYIEKKKELVGYDDRTWKRTGDSWEGKFVTKGMKLLSTLPVIKNGSFRTIWFGENKIYTYTPRHRT